MRTEDRWESIVEWHRRAEEVVFRVFWLGVRIVVAGSLLAAIAVWGVKMVLRAW